MKNKSKAYIRFLASIERKDVASFKRLLPQILKKENIEDIKKEVFLLGIEKNNTEIINSLIDNGFISKDNKTEIITSIVGNQNIEILNRLIKEYNLDKPFDKNIVPENYNYNYNYGLKMHDDILVRVLPLSLASYFGNVQIVKILLPISNPKGLKNRPLKHAIHGNKRDVIDILFDVSNVEEVDKNQESWEVEDQMYVDGMTYFKNKKKVYDEKKYLIDKINKNKTSKLRQKKI